MKKINTILILSVFLFMNAHSANVLMNDYEVPEGTAKSLFGSAKYNFSTDNSGSVTANNGDISTSFEMFHSSLPFGYSFGFDGKLSADGNIVPETTVVTWDTIIIPIGTVIGPNDTLLQAKTIIERDSITVKENPSFIYNIGGTAEAHKYFIKDFFGYGQLSARVVRDYDRPDITIDGGIGYGRFIRATPLARALRIEEELIESKVLKGELSKAVILELAKHLSPEIEKEYQVKHEAREWQRYYFDAMEKILAKSDMLRDGTLGSYGSVIVEEVLKEIVLERYYGYSIRGGFGYDLLTPYEDADRDFFGTVHLDFAWPVGLKSQLIERVSFQAPLSNDKAGKEYTFTTNTSYSYELSDKIDAIISYSLTGSKLDISGNDLEFDNGLTIQMLFYIANKFNISTSFGFTKPYEAEKTSAKIGLGLLYRIF